MDKNLKNLLPFQKPAPRYTSYPTAIEFRGDFDARSYKTALQNHIAHDAPLSLYVHLPFCESACYFCACNVIYTNSEAKKSRYLEYLAKEVALIAPMIPREKQVVQLHFGGGTPTYFSAAQLDFVIRLLRNNFKNFAPDAELSCEIDPRFFNEDQMQILKNGGFNRLSFGLQDFDDGVQRAVNRVQSFELVEKCVKIARDAGIKSINFDLIYGLPRQTLQSFQTTLTKTLALSPDRLAIFNYAHVPWVKKTMAKINENELPDPETKLKIFDFLSDFLQRNDFFMIGMDHFAKKDDPLFEALENGTLRRNFQGYTTKGFSQTIGMGVTAISEGHDFYAQNFKDLNAYEKHLDAGELPTERGVQLLFDDVLRKEVIMSLMNNNRVFVRQIEEKFGVIFERYFEKELDALQIFVKNDLIFVTPDEILVTDLGKIIIRNIAMTFDARTKTTQNDNKFSKSI